MRKIKQISTLAIAATLAGCVTVAGSKRESPTTASWRVPVVSEPDPVVNEENAKRITRGMTAVEVEAILGRPPDASLRPGGSLGGSECFWYGKDHSQIAIYFESSTTAGAEFTPPRQMASSESSQ